MLNTVINHLPLELSPLSLANLFTPCIFLVHSKGPLHASRGDKDDSSLLSLHDYPTLAH